MNMLESRWNMMERDGAEKEQRLSNVSYATICNNFRAILLYLYFFFWPRFRMQRFTLRCFIYATFSHLFALFSVFRFLDLDNMLKMMRISFKKKGLYKGV